MKDLTKTEEILLLSILQLGKEAYGLKIRHHVSEILDKDFTCGNLYCALQKLTIKKYVDKHRGESTDLDSHQIPHNFPQYPPTDMLK